MGFDNLKRPLFNERRTLINYPAVVMQIDQDAQAVIFDDDPKRYMARIGTISPEDRQIRVTRSVSTIVQFRVLDYGMEWCDLQLTIPLNSDDSVQICDGNMALAIHRLNASSLLNGKKLGYKARPARVSKIAEIELSKMKDVDFRRRVSCRMGEVLTFEIVHSSVESDCYVEWWQDPDKSTTAVYVVQHSTA
ncbi:hypothetical protein GLOTRDRAFT_80906 [Gloeophyllum trabeum ATCC 11539]|uniref:Ubiquitin 3 binding protein But2 C-terminal domain-containing protein n=1 Tax=Gloeophyllum trabeum (strain ATCC 11539 / FP-39264 / Madison 617) TaxID=670483 RepID=S7PWI2_GLOTA|nr:uncharacterized protein GLOTRDRAFT_80906 [Gloeophyllum trabeum ATCC 11539]EPQ51898.1 hypothetical protein GLOTRDRAFT_80906 [Gloeophyllum trabeum ATCC 11539]